MARRAVFAGLGAAGAVLLSAALLCNAGATLRVWDNGGEQDDRADVYFDGNLLGRNDSPYERSWDLGELSAGSHQLTLIHREYSSPTGTYGWEITGAGIVARDDDASVDRDGSVTIGVLDNDTSMAVTGGGSPVLAPDDVYNETISVQAGSSSITILSAGMPMHGSASIVSGGKAIRYTPTPRYTGSDRFTYTIRNASGATAQGSVDIDVLYVNNPPTANAGALYVGFTDEPVTLDASLSRDPDIEDSLQYRWDLDNDGRFDTDWLSQPRHDATFTAPTVGRVEVEVRDVYRGQPTGATDRATAMVRIAQRPPELRAVLFVDLDGDGLPNGDDPPLPQIQLALDGESQAVTGDDGTASFPNLGAGEHTVSVTKTGLALLQLQGFGFDLDPPEITLDVPAGPPTIALFPVRSVVGSLSGLVYIDTDGSGEREQGEPPVPGLTVSLGEGLERTTDENGRFLFMNVAAGEYALTIESEQHRWDGSIVIDAGEKTERTVIWPSPDSGFLDVKIELDRPGTGEGG